MISLILWVIAPIFNAIMDLTENENFSQSIFFDKTEIKRLGKYKWNHWWYKRDSDDVVKKILGYRPDAWHISKSIMILLFLSSLIVEVYFEGPFLNVFTNIWLNASMELILKGWAWNLIFTIFYHKLFRSKTWRK